MHFQKNPFLLDLIDFIGANIALSIRQGFGDKTTKYDDLLVMKRKEVSAVNRGMLRKL